MSGCNSSSSSRSSSSLLLNKRYFLSISLGHERLQHLRYEHTIIGLIVLQDAADGARRSAHGRIQHVNVLGVLVHLLRLAVANAQTPRLIIGAVGAGDELAESARAREPRLQIVLLRRGIIQRPAYNDHDAIGKSEDFVKLLGVADHLLQHLPGLVVAGLGDAELFDFLELMDAKDAAGVAAMRAHLLPEAAGEAGVADGQCALCDPLVPVECGYRLLGRRDQVFLLHALVLRVLARLAHYFVQLFVELTQLGHLLHHLFSGKKN